MTAAELSRRSFLVLAGGTLLVAACGSDDTSAGTSPGSDTGAGDTGNPANDRAGVVSSDLHVSDHPQRMAIAILAGNTAGSPYASGRPAKVAIFGPDRPDDAAPSWITPTLRNEGLPEGRGVYTFEPVLDAAGVWRGKLDYDGVQSDFYFQVNAQAAVPVAGDRAISVPTATTRDSLGVDPICTLDPPCPYHQVSLDDALASGKPVVVQFSTPARCQTQYCGPVLESLVAAGPDYEDRVDILHVEIYQDLRSPNLADAVGPDGWGLPSEPWMFAIDPSGTIVARVDGGFDRSETRALLDTALAS